MGTSFWYALTWFLFTFRDSISTIRAREICPKPEILRVSFFVFPVFSHSCYFCGHDTSVQIKSLSSAWSNSCIRTEMNELRLSLTYHTDQLLYMDRKHGFWRSNFGLFRRRGHGNFWPQNAGMAKVEVLALRISTFCSQEYHTSLDMTMTPTAEMVQRRLFMARDLSGTRAHTIVSISSLFPHKRWGASTFDF